MVACQLKKRQKEDIPGTEENTRKDIQKKRLERVAVVVVIVVVRGSSHGTF